MAARAARRAALRAALERAALAWPAARADDERALDGWDRLMRVFDRTHPARSALVRLTKVNDTRACVAEVLLACLDTRQPEESAPAPAECDGELFEVDDLSQALAVVARRGLAVAALPRRALRALTAEGTGAVVSNEGIWILASEEAEAIEAPFASIAFDEPAESPIDTSHLAEALGFPAEALDLGGGAAQGCKLSVHVRLREREAIASYLLSGAISGAPLVWAQDHEPPPAVVAPPMVFSATRLNAFAQCPRRWFFTYLCDALEETGSAAAAYGKVFHEALEALHRAVRRPHEHAASEMLERLRRELDSSFERHAADFASPLEREVARQKAGRVAAHYVRWLSAEAADQPLEIVHVELAQRWAKAGHQFVGYIDRIDRPLGGGPVTIFDYKTGRLEPDPHAYLERIREGDEAQLALYFAMLTAQDEEVARLGLVSVGRPAEAWVLALDVVDAEGAAVARRRPREGVVSASCSRADFEEALGKLVERCDLLTRRGVQHFAAGGDPPCSYCTYARACRERPPHPERIFAR